MRAGVHVLIGIAVAATIAGSAAPARATGVYVVDFIDNRDPSGISNGWVTYGGGSYYSGEYHFRITPPSGPAYDDWAFCTRFTSELNDPQASIVTSVGLNGPEADSRAAWLRAFFDGYTGDAAMNAFRASFTATWASVLANPRALDQAITLALWEMDVYYQGFELFDVLAGTYRLTNTSLGSAYVDELGAMANQLFAAAAPSGWQPYYYMPEPSTSGQPQLFAAIQLPEPGALALAGLGLAGVIVARVRRRGRPAASSG